MALTRSRIHLYVCLLAICFALAGCTDQIDPITLEPISVPSPTLVATSLPATPTALNPEPTQTIAQNASPVGTWVGGFQLPDGSTSEQRINLSFTKSADLLEGAIELPLDNEQAQLDAITLDNNAIHFSWAASSGTTTFDGQINGDRIDGTVQRGSEKSTFAFVRTEESSDYEQYVGTYRLPSGEAIGFYEPAGGTQIFPTSIMYANLQTGDLGAAIPTADDSFAIGPVIGLAYPFRGEARFTRNEQGKVNSMVWTQPGAADVSADKVQVNNEEVTFTGGDGAVTLAGRLVTPSTPGKHPVVIIVHGAGEVTRKNFLTDMLAGLFAANDIATFSYDKRGVGDSGGTYVSRGNASRRNLELLASDALAAVEYLKGRAEIDPALIGMQGNSQAGWIIPLAAGKSKDVAFMIMWSGPGVSQGISDMYDRLAETTSREELTKTLQETPPFGFDPIPSLEQTTAPGFWAYGDVDKTVPVPESIAGLEKVKAAGQKDFTWKVFPNGDHFLLASGAAPNGDLRFTSGYVPGLLGATITWMKAHTSAK